jgi:hypothetical protein
MINKQINVSSSTFYLPKIDDPELLFSYAKKFIGRKYYKNTAIHFNYHFSTHQNSIFLEKNGRHDRIRTCDRSLKRGLLYQLSYVPPKPTF